MANGFKKLYTTSLELKDVVGVSEVTRPQLQKLIWAYIKERKLQDPKNGKIIIPDAKLAKVLGDAPISMFKMVSKTGEHLTDV